MKKKKLVFVRFREDRNRWEADYRDQTGKRHRPLFETEEQAHAHALEISQTIGRGVLPVADSEISLSEYVERWKATRQSQLAPRTFRSYCERLVNHVLPALGSYKVREIKRRHVKALLDEKQRAGHAPNSIRLVRAALSTILTDAQDAEIVMANVCIGLGRKHGMQPGTLTKADRQTANPMNRAQRDTFLRKANENPDRRWSVLFQVLALAGLRPSEALALKPGDVDFQGQTIKVERALEMDRTVRPVKTYESRRVDLTPRLAASLKDYLRWLTEQALCHGWGPPQWCFPSEDGKPLDDDQTRKAFARVLKRAEMGGFTPYSLRHTFASLLLASGTPLTYASQQMGHSSPATTLRFYAKWIPGEGRRWVDTLDSQEPKPGTTGGPRLVSAGAGGGTRTHDLLITNQLLCH